jgi:hypothetical protein
METVDVAEVAALERAAEAHAYTADGGGLCGICQLSPAAKVHMLPSHEVAAAQDQLRAESSVLRVSPTAAGVDGGSTPTSPVAPPPEPTSPRGALEQLVEQAIDARLGPIRDALQRIERRGVHTMAVAMVLQDRLNITPEEVDAMYAQLAQIERGRK